MKKQKKYMYIYIYIRSRGSRTDLITKGLILYDVIYVHKFIYNDII